MLKTISAALVCFGVTVSSSADAPPAAQAEIDHLLRYLAQSECRFYRNGRWHDGAAARAHLGKKYAYLADKGLVQRAEDFILRAASESSVSHEPYRVRCGTAEPVPSAQWFTEELRRHRLARHK